MKDFIINLYANKYFPIYLGVVIIVLLIAFFIVFFLGKKDQKKIEETQKLNLEKLKDIKLKLSGVNIKDMSQKLEIGEMTLKDIIDELSKPGRDPRDEMPKPILRSDVLKFEDLKEGMVLNGTVRNVIDFGAFVDIGVKHDGLVHISELSENYVKNPSDVVSIGDIVKVKVIKIDNDRQKVSLSMKI